MSASLPPQATVSPSFCNVAYAKTGIAIVDVLTPLGAPAVPAQFI